MLEINFGMLLKKFLFVYNLFFCYFKIGEIYIVQLFFTMYMYVGKMTATWLILVVIIGCLIVPLMVIWLHSIIPYLKAHPNTAHVILGSISLLIPDISISGFISDIQI